jgi:hypothetical protein
MPLNHEQSNKKPESVGKSKPTQTNQTNETKKTAVFFTPCRLENMQFSNKENGNDRKDPPPYGF